MRTFLICYDLSEPSANKADVVSAIMLAAQSWARPLESVWYIRTDRSQQELEGELRDVVGLDDGLLIQAVREEAVLLNTGLRWFRQRRVEPMNAHGNVLPFRSIAPHNDVAQPEPIKAAS